MWCEHRFWAQEDGANITVNSVHPGLIMTPLMRHSALLMSLLFSLSASLSLKLYRYIHSWPYLQLCRDFEVFHLSAMEECTSGKCTYTLNWAIYLLIFHFLLITCVCGLNYLSGSSDDLLRGAPSEPERRNWEVLLGLQWDDTKCICQRQKVGHWTMGF